MRIGGKLWLQWPLSLSPSPQTFSLHLLLKTQLAGVACERSTCCTGRMSMWSERRRNLSHDRASCCCSSLLLSSPTRHKKVGSTFADIFSLAKNHRCHRKPSSVCVLRSRKSWPSSKPFSCNLACGSRCANHWIQTVAALSAGSRRRSACATSCTFADHEANAWYWI